MALTESHRIHEPGPRQLVNQLLGERAFERGDALALHGPLELHLQLTSGCNLDCIMCHEHLRPEATRHGKDLRTLDAATLARIEREILPYSSRLHLGVGGEPMLAPYFLEFVERAHAKNQRIHLTTNGTRIATERVAEVLARCVHAIEVSVDGATAETYERIRGGASFARLVKNLELLNRHRAYREPDDRPRLTLCMVLMRSNVHELPLLVEFAAQHSADAVAAWPVIPVTPEGRADMLDLVAARPHIARARARAKELGLALDLPFEHGAPEAVDSRDDRTAALRKLAALDAAGPGGSVLDGSRSRQHCHMPTLALYILWDGRAYPCANPEAHQGDALGDLSTESFADVWNGRPFRNLRAGLAAGDAPEVCRRCPILHRSAGPVEGTRSDLVSWFGERELAPGRTAAGELVEAAVASGLAAHVHERHFKLLGYSHLLEREVHRQGSDNERLLHERDAALLHLDALVVERGHLKAHADVLARDRESMRARVEQLEPWARGVVEDRARVIADARALEAEVRRRESDNERLRHERDAAQLHVDALAAERGHLKAHADVLARDRESLREGVQRLESRARGLVEDRARVIADARALEAEVRRLADEVERLRHAGESARLQRDSLAAEGGELRTHADILARERRALALHAATLESEREQLVRHAANLERILARTRARAVHRSLSNLKDFVVRPRPRAPYSYVPPWVADGSRPEGAPPAKLDE